MTRLAAWLAFAALLVATGFASGYRWRSDAVRAAVAERDTARESLRNLQAQLDRVAEESELRRKRIAQIARQASKTAAERTIYVDRIIHAPASPSPDCGPAIERLRSFHGRLRDYQGSGIESLPDNGKPAREASSGVPGDAAGIEPR